MSSPAEHERDLSALLAVARRDLEIVFSQAATADEVRDALLDVAPRLVPIYGSAAAALAADWYDDLREQAGMPGRFRAIPAEYVADDGRTDSLARWAVEPMYSAEPAKALALGKAWGGVQRLIADADRETVLGSIRQDARAGGWSRHTDGDACEFCVEIAARGAVYSARTADFGSHDDCMCLAVPAFGLVRKVREYTPSQKFALDTSRDSHNARTRAWLAD